MKIEQLIDDYDRKIVTLNRMIEDTEYYIKVSQEVGKMRGWMEKVVRLKTKRGCYRAFIAELQRVV